MRDWPKCAACGSKWYEKRVIREGVSLYLCEPCWKAVGGKAGTIPDSWGGCYHGCELGQCRYYANCGWIRADRPDPWEGER